MTSGVISLEEKRWNFCDPPSAIRKFDRNLSEQ